MPPSMPFILFVVKVPVPSADDQTFRNRGTTIPSGYNAGIANGGWLMTLLDADEKQLASELGEDTCELLATIEDSFGIQFGDYHALLGMTVRELAGDICKKAEYSTAERCLSAVMFYRLRRALRVLFGTPRTAIGPATPVGDLLPWNSRRTRWCALQAYIGLTLPPLNYPGWLVYLSLAMSTTFLISLRVLLELRLSVVEIFGGSLALCLPTMVALIPLARTLPSGCETVGGLTKVVLARNYAAFASQYGSSSESDVLVALRQLIATETGRDVEEILPETNIPRDLDIE